METLSDCGSVSRRWNGVAADPMTRSRVGSEESMQAPAASVAKESARDPAKESEPKAPAVYGAGDHLASKVSGVGDKVAAGITARASAVSSRLRSGATAAVDSGLVRRSATAGEVDPTVKAAVGVAREGAAKTAGVTAAVVGGVTTAIGSVARSAATAAIAGGKTLLDRPDSRGADSSPSGSRGAAASKRSGRGRAMLAGAIKAGAATVSAVGTVLKATRGAATEVAGAATDATATLVDHRYGEGHGDVLRDVGGAAVDVARATSVMSGGLLRGIGKKVVTKTAEETVSAVRRTTSPEQTPQPSTEPATPPT